MVLFDLTATQPCGKTVRHGGGRYGEIIFRRILELKLPVACYYNSRLWLNPTILDLLKEYQIQLFDINKFSLEEIVEITKSSVLYSALPQYSLFKFDACKVVGTIHGLRRLETPVDFYRLLYRNGNWKDLFLFMFQLLFPHIYEKMLCRYKKREWTNSNFQFVTVSFHSQCIMKVYFPFFKDKNIPVFYSPSTSVDRCINRKYLDKYFMLVSANRADKNNLRAIKALDMLFDLGYLSDYTVRITGVKSSDNFYYRIRNIDRFKFLGYIDDNDLEQLYHDAYALIYPSLNEGFGYPPLEAMHYGVPVLASPYASISEICEGAVMYFNPFSIKEIAARVLRILNQEVWNDLSAKGKEQYVKISNKQKADLDALINYVYSKEG